MPNVYLAQWEWFNNSNGMSYWRSPGGSAVGTLDLRSIPQQALAGGTPQGYGIFVYSSPQTIAGAVDLGSVLSRVLTNGEKVGIRNRFSLSEVPTSTTLLDLLWDLLGKYSDPTGQVRCKPITPTVQGMLELHLGGFSLIRSESFDINTHPHRDKVLAVLKNDYMTVDHSALRRRVLGNWMRKYGVTDHTMFLPLGVPDEGWQPPETTITDNFNTDTSANYAADNGAFRINFSSSGVWEATTTEAICRHTATSLSSADHYSQLKHVTIGTSWNGPMARKIASGTLTYYASLDQGSVVKSLNQFRRVTGTYTQQGSGYGYTPASGDILKIEANGSTITSYLNGTNRVQVTDSNITGNLQAGLLSNHLSDDFDDWEAADLAGGPTQLTYSNLTDSVLPTEGFLGKHGYRASFGENLEN